MELKNISNQDINLNGWAIADLARTATINEDIIIKPDSFVILTTNSRVGLFAPYGRALGVTAFPTLNNSGDEITLSDDNNNIIHQITYNSDWQTDNAKSNGWSFELISPKLLCLNADNWEYAISNNGGTPGSENSIDKNSDLIPKFKLLQTDISQNKLSLSFSQSIDTAHFKSALAFIDTSMNSMTFHFISGEEPLYELMFDEPLATEKQYFLIAPKVYSCSMQDSIVGVKKFFCYKSRWMECDTFPRGHFRDIIITEVLFNTNDQENTKNEFIELYNPSERSFNLKNWFIADERDSVIISTEDLILKPDSLIILTESEFYISNNKIVSVNNLPTLNNDEDIVLLLNKDSLLIDSIAYKSSDFSELVSGTSIQLRNKSSYCLGADNWYIDNSKKISPLIFENIATQNINIQSISISDQSIEITFDKKLKNNSLEGIKMYDAQGNIANFTSLINEASVLLRLDQPLNIRQEYALKISNIQDCANYEHSLDTTFHIYHDYISQVWQTSSVENNLIIGDIVFNELMFQPDRNNIDIPFAEYIELYNRLDKPIHTSHILLCKDDDCQTLQPYLLQPEQYVLLVNPSNYEQFNEYSNVIPITKNITLTNSEGNYYLRDRKGNLLHLLEYNNANYSDDFRSNTGYSLELINPNYPFSDFTSWTYSKSKNQGTPAIQNSYSYSNYEDINPPYTAYAFVDDKADIIIHFSKLLNPNIIHRFLDNISTTPNIDFSNASFSQENFRQILLQTSSQIQGKDIYKIVIDTLYDFYGNIRLKDTAFIGNFAPADTTDIIVNEVLFNASEDNEEFVELYNHSDKVIDLSKLKLSVHSSPNEINAFVYCSLDTFPFLPNTYIALTADKATLLAYYSSLIKTKNIVQVPNFPTLRNDEGYISLLNADDKLVERIYYNDDFHNEILPNPQNVSLERIRQDIRADIRSAWLTSSYPNYATPTTQNSQHSSLNVNNINASVTLHPNTISPNGDGYKDYTEIAIQTGQSNASITMNIFAHDGQLIKRFVHFGIIGNTYTTIWNGLDNDFNIVPTGAYVLKIAIHFDNGSRRNILKNIFVINQ